LLVEDIMTRDVETVSPSTNICDALAIMEERRIRHLPVLAGGALVGIVSEGDLKEAQSLVIRDCREGAERRTPVEVVMRRRVFTAHPLDPIEEAALVMYRRRIGCLPVVSGGELVGIVTQTDLIRSLVELMGVNRSSSRLEVQVPDRPGMLAQIAELIRKHGVNISSVLTLPAEEAGEKKLVFRLQTIDLRRIAGDIREAGYRITWPPTLDETR